MRILARSLVVVLPAFLAGVVAWMFLPSQPERSVLVPAGTKLLEFSPAGRYVVTFQRDERRLTLRQTDTGEATYEVEIPCVIPSNVSTNGARAFYGFSADDHQLAIVTTAPDKSRLVIVDLHSGNIVTPVAQLPPDPDHYRPRPAFSSDGRYLSYFSEDDHGEECAVLYDLAGRQEQLRVPDISDSLGPPTCQGKWLLVNKASGIELWDVVQKRRESILPVWPPGWSMISTSLSPDEQTVTALCFVCRPFPKQHILLHRCDLSTRKIETGWDYPLASPAGLLWNMASDPNELLLIKTLDDDGAHVQDLLDVTTGHVLARYTQPIDMLEDISLFHSGQIAHHGPGLTHSLGRTGEMAIDSKRQVLVSKQISRPNFSWQYYLNNIALRWLGINLGRPRLCLQFHSVETGRLLERVPLQIAYFFILGGPTLALHPTQPLLAVIDEDGSNSRLQFWRVPPPRPWAWIAACALMIATVVLLICIEYSKARRRKLESASDVKSNPPFPTSMFCLMFYFASAFCLSYEFLPADAWAIFGERAAGNTLPLTLSMPAIFLFIGIVLHVVLYRWNPQRFQATTFRKVGVILVAMLAAWPLLSIVLSRATGLPPSILSQRFNAIMYFTATSFLVMAVVFLAIVFLWLFLHDKYHPGNRMGRRIQAGDFAGAIRIGEKRPVQRRDFLTNFNLVAAYAQSGQKEKAKQLLAFLEQTQRVPKYYTLESFKLSLDQLRLLVEPDSCTGSLMKASFGNP